MRALTAAAAALTCRAVVPPREASKLVVGPRTVMTAAIRPGASKMAAAMASMPGKKRL
jgi:hypothetical protein